jgi:pseudaminic acid cytidylyltransferase
MNLCIIPARGGSKRIPKKNIKYFCGKPIIIWSIQRAKESKCFDKIIVSTDSLKIAKLAVSYGAEVPFLRSRKLSDDYTSTVSVISDAINREINKFKKPKYVCCIYATAPFINSDDLKMGLKLLKKFNPTYTFPATNYAHPIQRSFKINKNKKLKMFYPRYYNYRTQDLEKAFHDVGQFYWAKTETWLKKIPIINNNSIPISIPRERAHDIDTFEDWKIAENYFLSLNFKK